MRIILPFALLFSLCCATPTVAKRIYGDTTELHSAVVVECSIQIGMPFFSKFEHTSYMFHFYVKDKSCLLQTGRFQIDPGVYFRPRLVFDGRQPTLYRVWLPCVTLIPACH